jgi:hypothetical protein
LLFGKWLVITTFKLDAYRKIITTFFTGKTGLPGMPGLSVKWHVLSYLSATPDQYMGRNAQMSDARKVCMRIGIQLIGEQMVNPGTPKFAGR